MGFYTKLLKQQVAAVTNSIEEVSKAIEDVRREGNLKKSWQFDTRVESTN